MNIRATGLPEESSQTASRMYKADAISLAQIS